MDQRRSIFITLIIGLFIGLAALIGLVAFRLGQMETSRASVPGDLPLVAALATPSPTTEPPLIVTNTPSLTPIPTATSGPTPTPSPTPTFTPSPTLTPTPTSTPTPTPTPIVVITHVQALGRLETAEFAMRTTIDLKNDPSNLWEQLFGSDKVLLMAEGEVVAGFDLGKVSKDDIVSQGTMVKITLPPPEIFYTRIDNERTFVYERSTGLLVKPDPSLEGRARLLAEQALTDWAIERGIHNQAEMYGRIRLENLLRSLGFTSIIIEVKKSGT